MYTAENTVDGNTGQECGKHEGVGNTAITNIVVSNDRRERYEKQSANSKKRHVDSYFPLDMWPLNSVILTPMASPKALKTPATAIATNAAATAYSESSRPVSFFRKALNIAVTPEWFEVKRAGFGNARRVRETGVTRTRLTH